MQQLIFIIFTLQSDKRRVAFQFYSDRITSAKINTTKIKVEDNEVAFIPLTCNFNAVASEHYSSVSSDCDFDQRPLAFRLENTESGDYKIKKFAETKFRKFPDHILK